jgi:hypothetical protein
VSTGRYQEEREERAYKKSKRKNCGKKQEIEDFLTIDLHKMEMLEELG